jgi:hypothetical protein
MEWDVRLHRVSWIAVQPVSPLYHYLPDNLTQFLGTLIPFCTHNRANWLHGYRELVTFCTFPSCTVSGQTGCTGYR